MVSIPKSSYHLGSEVAYQPCKGFGGKVTRSRKALWSKTLFVIPRNRKNREERGRKKKGGLSSSSSFLQACKIGWPHPKDNPKDFKNLPQLNTTVSPSILCQYKDSTHMEGGTRKGK